MGAKIDRLTRDFNRFTGDGLPDEPTGAPLPIGDPKSGPFVPTKADYRELVEAIAVEAQGPQGLPGDMSGANNLSEIDDASAARQNLGFGAFGGGTLGASATAQAARTALSLGAAALLGAPDENDLTEYPNDVALRKTVDRAIAATRFTSTAQTIVQGGLATVAHGFGSVPGIICYRLACAAPDAGYDVGDHVYVDLNGSNAGSNRYSTAQSDASNIYVRFSSDVFAFAAGRKDTGAVTGLTNSSWQLYIEARL